MVLAAGRGERLRPITDKVPKPLVPVAGKPLIVYHLEALQRAGIRDVVINLSWLGALIRETLGDGNRYGVRISYSDEGPVPLEAAGGIFHALPMLGSEPFLVVNGDVWLELELASLWAAGDPVAQALAHLVLVPNPPQHPKGDFALQGARIVDGDENRLTYAGVGVYRPEFFEGCQPGAFPLLPLLRRALKAGRLGGERFDGLWFDVGTPERLAALDEMLRRRTR
jgi:N-acetyl-alpha-D-muramate 1-phosphate uridylyltransferase